jgi:hypothetical protein
VLWRTKFTDCADKRRQDVCNKFPFINKMPVFAHQPDFPADDPPTDDENDEDDNPPRVDHRIKRDKFGFIEGAITLELFQPICTSPNMAFSDFRIGEFPESFNAAVMRFSYRCEMKGQLDPSFLLCKESRVPLGNYAEQFHSTSNTDLPFSYPGALGQYMQAHARTITDKQAKLEPYLNPSQALSPKPRTLPQPYTLKQIEAEGAADFRAFATTTHDGLLQGRSYGSLVLATHIAHVKSGFYASDSVSGMAAVLEFVSETTADGYLPFYFTLLLCVGLLGPAGACVGLRWPTGAGVGLLGPTGACWGLRWPAGACVGLLGPALACVGLRWPALDCWGLRWPTGACRRLPQTRRLARTLPANTDTHRPSRRAQWLQQMVPNPPLPSLRCNFFRLLNQAREHVDNDKREYNASAAGRMRSVVGLMAWRDIYDACIIKANSSYTMHATNLTVFYEMLTRYCNPGS